MNAAPQKVGPHWRLDARIGWRSTRDDGNVALGDVVELRTAPGDARPLVDGTGSFGGFTEATGIAIDDRGDAYVLDREHARLHRFDVCAQRFEEIAHVGGKGSAPRMFNEPTGLAFHPRGDLLIVDSGNRRVQSFTRKGWALRRIFGPFAFDGTRLNETVDLDGAWQPWDVATACDGSTLVSDRDGFIHVFDATGIHRASWDGEADGVAPLEDPRHLAVARNGHVFVVEGEDRVRELSPSGEFVRFVELVGGRELADRFCPVGVAVDTDGNIYVTERVTGRLFASGPTASSTLRPSLAYSGLGLALAFDEHGEALVGGSAITRLASMVGRAPSGEFIAGPLDGRRRSCQWHRVLLDGVLPDSARVEVATFTSDVSNAGADVLPSADSSEWVSAGQWSAPGTAWDGLIQSPPGRYLWARIRLFGNGESTPALRSIRVEYPRKTSAGLLPAVYQRDASSWDFMQRFVAMFDSVRGRDTQILSNFTRYLDAGGAPVDDESPRRDFLAWLSSWVGIVADGDWSEAQRRALLVAAPELFRWRGTARGLRAHIKAYTGIEPTILEHHRVRRWTFLGSSRLGDNTDLFGLDIVDALELGANSTIGEFLLTDRSDPRTDPFSVHANRFTVYAPSPRPLSPSQRATLERVVEEAKPAHTEATIVVVGSHMRIGTQSRVGVDTIVGEYPSGVTANESRLGEGTVLSPSEDESTSPTFRIGIRSRVGAHTLID